MGIDWHIYYDSWVRNLVGLVRNGCGGYEGQRRDRDHVELEAHLVVLQGSQRVCCNDFEVVEALGRRVSGPDTDLVRGVLGDPGWERRAHWTELDLIGQNSDWTVVRIWLVAGHGVDSLEKLSFVNRVNCRCWNRIRHQVERLGALDGDVLGQRLVYNPGLRIDDFDFHLVNTRQGRISFGHVDCLGSAQGDETDCVGQRRAIC